MSEVKKMYPVGAYIVKSTNGVCRIKDIVNPDFVADSGKLYYQLVPLLDESATLYVPVDKVDETMRLVMTEAEAEELLKKIPSINQIWVSNEKERERNYKAAILSNDPEQLIGIIKLIYQRKKARQEQGKKTTTVDGRYFSLAENLLYSELELVLQKDKDEVYQLIKKNCEG